jgi:glucose-6-phosphate isomerase
MEQQNVRTVDREAWKALSAHREELKAKQVHMRDLFAQDPERFRRFSFEWNNGALLLDYSKNIITDETLHLLRQLAGESDIKGWTNKMFSGEKINFTENRYCTPLET